MIADWKQNDKAQGVDMVRNHCKYPKRNTCVDPANYKKPEAWKCVWVVVFEMLCWKCCVWIAVLELLVMDQRQKKRRPLANHCCISNINLDRRRRIKVRLKMDLSGKTLSDYRRKDSIEIPKSVTWSCWLTINIRLKEALLSKRLIFTARGSETPSIVP